MFSLYVSTYIETSILHFNFDLLIGRIKKRKYFLIGRRLPFDVLFRLKTYLIVGFLLV